MSRARTNFSSVGYIAGWLLVALAATMLLPLVFAAAAGDVSSARAFTLSAMIVTFVGGGLVLSLSGAPRIATRGQVLQLIVVVWTLIPLAAAIPFVLSRYYGTPLDAYFEAVSGFTTTGATVLEDPGAVPRAIVVWRAALQWLGGLATLGCFILMAGPLSELGGLDPQLRLVIERPGSSLWYRTPALVNVPAFYSLLTLACLFALLLCGIPAIDAFCLALSTIATGGFQPRLGALELYGSQSALLVISLFMALSAVSIVWLRSLMLLRWRELVGSREPLLIFAIILLIGGALSALILQLERASGVPAILERLVLGIATIASLVSTTGFHISERTEGLIPLVLLFSICAIGGGRLSTAGGLRYARVAILVRQSVIEIRRLVYPHGVTAGEHREATRVPASLRIVWTNIGFLLLALAVLTMLLGVAGLGLPVAIMGAISAISNVGPAYLMTPAGAASEIVSYGQMPVFAKLALILGMLFGRIEVLALLSLFRLAFWRQD